MSDGFTIAVSAGASLLAAVLALSGDAIVRSVDRRREQARRDGEALVPVLAYLADANPQRVAMNLPTVAEDALAIARSMGERMEDIRRQLYLLGISHPSADVRQGAKDLVVRMLNVQYWLSRMIADMAKHRDAQDSTRGLEVEHKAANNLAADLARLMAPRRWFRSQ